VSYQNIAIDILAVMKNKIISFLEAPSFKSYTSSLFPKSRYRDFKLIQFQIGVLTQSLREWVTPMERLFKNFFVASNMRELYGDRISRLTKRINSGEKYANGEYPRDVYDDLRERAIQVRSMQHEVLFTLLQEFEAQKLFKVHQVREDFARLRPENQDYLTALFSKEVSIATMSSLIVGVDANARLTDAQLKSVLFALESHGLVEKGEFTEKFNQEMIYDDPTLFEYEKQTPFKMWLASRDYPKSLNFLISGLFQSVKLSNKVFLYILEE